MLKKFVFDNPGFDTDEIRAAIKKLELEHQEGMLMSHIVAEVLGTEGANTLFNMVCGDLRLMDFTYLELAKYPISYCPYDLTVVQNAVQQEELEKIYDDGKNIIFVSSKLKNIFPDLFE